MGPPSRCLRYLNVAALLVLPSHCCATTASTAERTGAHPAHRRKANTDYAVSSGLSFPTSVFLYKYRFTREVIIILSKLVVQSKTRRSITSVISS